MKVVRTAVQVIGFVATVASFIPGPHQAIAQIVAAVAAVVSAGLSVMAKPPRPQGQGQLTSYRLDPAAPIPYMMGRTQYAGCCVHRDTFGTENKKQVFVSVYSLGPIQEIEKFQADRRDVIIGANEEAQGAWEDHMWLRTQLGLCPSPRLVPPGSQHDTPGDPYYLPGWGPNAKLSGLAASMWILKWDKDQKYFTNGPPVPGIIGKGVKVYDPRLDSTFPGGSGACRALNESTYVYSDTPHLHALTYALGRWQNGKRRFGIGFPVDAIDVAYFAEAASIDEANGWQISGVIFSNDDKWNSLKLMMQAGGGQPITLGGRLSGYQRAPKVSAATITSDELVGPASVVATQSQRQRLNGGIPRYRSEAHEWEVVAAEAVRVPAYVAQDGGDRTREFVYDLVADNVQSRQLTAYELAEMREFGPIELTLKIRWQGLRPGDCANLNIPELGLNNQKVIILTRSFDVERGGVTLTFKSETDSKHAFALGQAAGAPPMPELSAVNPYGPNNVPPAPTTWALSAYQLDGPTGTIPAVRFTGTFTNTIADEVEFAIREVGTTPWIIVGQSGAGTTEQVASQVASGSVYEGRVRELVDGFPSNPQYLAPVTAGSMQSGSILGQGVLATLNTVIVGTHIQDAQGVILEDYALLNQEQVFAPRKTYDFSSGVPAGFTYSNGTIAAAGGLLTLTRTANDPNLRISGLSLDGSKHYIIRVRIRNTSFASNSEWEGRCYYATGGHGYTSSFVNYKPTKPPRWVDGGWTVFEWDMSQLTAGGNDFITNTITDIRFDFVNLANPSVIEVDWVTFGDKSQDLLIARGVDDNADVTLDNTSAGIVGQGPGATAPAADVMNLYVPVGQNALGNSGFDSGTLAGWSTGPSNGTTGFTPTRGLNAIVGYYGQLNVAHARVIGTPAAGTYFDAYVVGSPYPPTLDSLKRYALPVAPGDRIFASILAAYHRLSNAALIGRYYDGNGTFVSEGTLATGGTSLGAANGDPANFTRIGNFFNVPAGSAIRYAIIYVRGNCIGGQADPYVFFTQAMLCKVPAGQTAWPNYQPGSLDRFSDRTGENVASSVSGQGPGATAPGSDVLNEYNPYSDGNRLRYSLLESGLIGWGFVGDSIPGSPTITKATNNTYTYVHFTGAFTASGQYMYAGLGPLGTGYDPSVNARVLAGERIFVGGRINPTAFADTTWRLTVRFMTDTGALVSDVVVATGLGNPSISTRQGGFVTVPATAVYATLFCQLVCGATTGTAVGRFAEPQISSAGPTQTVWPPFTPGPSNEFGADVTTQISGPASVNIDYDYTGATIAANVDLAWVLTYNGGNLTTGTITASITVSEGTVNGFNSTSGAQAITVTSGVANMTISALTTDVAKFTVSITRDGIVRKMLVTATKVKAAQPPSGGGGGGYSMAQTSGFVTLLVANITTFTNLLTDRIQITMPTGKTTARISVSLNPRWYPKNQTSNGPWNLEYKIQRNTGTTGSPVWTDIGVLQNSDPDPYIDNTGSEPPIVVSSSGAMVYTFDDTGRTAGSIYEYRVVARVSSGATTGNSGGIQYTGSVSVSAP